MKTENVRAGRWTKSWRTQQREDPGFSCLGPRARSSPMSVRDLDRYVLLVRNFSPKFFRGLEDRHRARRDLYRVTRARVARHP